MTDEQRVEWFHPTSGTIVGWLGVGCGAVMLVLSTGVLAGGFSVPGFVGGLLLAAAAWIAMLRPRVGLTADEVVMRGMFSTTRLPLAGVESVVVRQVLAVWVGGRRHVCAAVGHTYRDIARARRHVHGEPALVARSTDPIYADHVASMITEKAAEARREAGIDKRSPDQAAMAARVRRTWAWPEIAGVAALAVVLAVAVLG